MGSCHSKINERDVERSTRVAVRNPIIYSCCSCFSCCIRKQFNITNSSDSHASFAISPGPIVNISELSVNKLGKINIKKTGKDKIQIFKILSNKKKSIRIHSEYIFVTAFLFVDNEWKPLWSNREISSMDDITIWNYHVEEAKIDDVFHGIYDEEDE